MRLIAAIFAFFLSGMIARIIQHEYDPPDDFTIGLWVLIAIVFFLILSEEN